MSAAYDNLRGGLFGRSALTIGVMSVALLSLVGVTFGPTVSILETRSSVESEELRASSVVDLRRQLETFAAVGGPEATESTLARLRDVLPHAVKPIELYSMMRFCARGADFEIQSLNFGGTQDLGMRSSRDRVEQLEVNVSGQGELVSMLRLIELVEAQGYPLAVLDFAVQNDGTGSGRFQMRTSLGALYFAPISPTGSGQTLMSAEGAP